MHLFQTLESRRLLSVTPAGLIADDASLGHQLDADLLVANTSIYGRVLIDLDNDGPEYIYSLDPDPGFEGATVYADLNSNSALDPGEPTTTTDANGNFSLDIPDGLRRVRWGAIGPDPYYQYEVSLENDVLEQNQPNYVYTKLLINTQVRPTIQRVDIGNRWPGTPFPGIILFIDEDGDNVLDPGERNATTNASGIAIFEFPHYFQVTLSAIPPDGYWMPRLRYPFYGCTGEYQVSDVAVIRFIADARTSLPTDMNGDGQPDVIFREIRDGGYDVDGNDLRVHVPSQEEDRRLIPPDPSWTLGGVADFNGDGHGDVLWHQDTTGASRLAFMVNAVTQQTVNLPTVANLNWRLIDAGDFNNDGQYDLLWRRADDGVMTVWHMNGVNLIDFAPIAQVRNADWQVRGVVDLNYDGSADLLWLNTRTKQVLWWMMDGPQIQSFKTSGQFRLNSRIVGMTRTAPESPLLLLMDDGPWQPDHRRGWWKINTHGVIAGMEPIGDRLYWVRHPQN